MAQELHGAYALCCQCKYGCTIFPLGVVVWVGARQACQDCTRPRPEAPQLRELFGFQVHQQSISAGKMHAGSLSGFGGCVRPFWAWLQALNRVPTLCMDGSFVIFSGGPQVVFHGFPVGFPLKPQIGVPTQEKTSHPFIPFQGCRFKSCVNARLKWWLFSPLVIHTARVEVHLFIPFGFPGYHFVRGIILLGRVMNVTESFGVIYPRGTGYHPQQQVRKSGLPALG